MKNISLYMGVFLLLSLSACVSIDSYEEGHKFIAYGSNQGLNTEMTYTGGIHGIMPWNEMVIYDMREQSRTYTSEVLDKNGLEVKIEASINFKPNKSKSAALHLNYGEAYAEVYVDKIAKGAIKDVAGKYTAEELYSSKRENLEVEIETILEVSFAKDALLSLSFVEISDVDLPTTISNAIIAKEKQEQDNLLAEKKKVQEENLAKAKIAKAEGDFEAAKFQAKANREIANSITPALVQWEQLKVLRDNWDGKYPSTVAGDGADLLLNIK